MRTISSGFVELWWPLFCINVVMYCTIVPKPLFPFPPPTSMVVKRTTTKASTPFDPCLSFLFSAGHSLSTFELTISRLATRVKKIVSDKIGSSDLDPEDEDGRFDDR